MRFTVTADTDIGIAKGTNQDSVLFKHGTYSGGEVLMAVICDGMGGLNKGRTCQCDSDKSIFRLVQQRTAV
mgnify:CR=1 FL=1